MEKVRPRGNKRALIQSHLAKLEKNVGRRKLFHDLEFCYEVPDSSLYCDNFQLVSDHFTLFSNHSLSTK